MFFGSSFAYLEGGGATPPAAAPAAPVQQQQAGVGDPVAPVDLFVPHVASVPMSNAARMERMLAHAADGPLLSALPEATADAERRRVSGVVSGVASCRPTPTTRPAPPVTNIIRVDVADVGNSTEVATGSPTLCCACNAVMSHLSVVTPCGADGSTHRWVCEFCGVINEVEGLYPEELPNALARVTPAKGIDYLITPPTVSAEGGDGSALDTSAVLFVCDMSGSMSVTVPANRQQASELGVTEEADVSAFGLSEEEMREYRTYMARQPVHVSRRQALTNAVTRQIQRIAAAHPHRRVGLITFASDVLLHGDASEAYVTLAGSNLMSEEKVRQAAARIPLTAPVTGAAPNLKARLATLQENGQTALGPAVLAAVTMASTIPRSRVVVITDGMSNVGLGALVTSDGASAPSGHAADTAALSDEATAFYSRVAAQAAAAGIVIDVVGFEGAVCNLQGLVALTEATGGSLTRSGILNLDEHFSSKMADQVVATSASLQLIAHAGLTVSDPTANDRQPGATTPSPADAAPAMPAAAPVLRSSGSGVHRRGRGVGQTLALATVPYAQQADASRDATPAAAAAAAPAPAAAAPAPAAASAAPAAAAPAPASGAGADGDAWGASTLSIPIGNVTSSTRITLTYAQRNPEGMSAELRREMSRLRAVPFQVQITYTRTDGATCLRVITQSLAITRRVEEAESAVHVATVTAHADRETRSLAAKGKYAKAATSNVRYQAFLARNVRDDDAEGRSAYAHWSPASAALQQQVVTELREERATRTRGTPAPREVAAAPPPVMRDARGSGGGGLISRVGNLMGGMLRSSSRAAVEPVASSSPPMRATILSDVDDGVMIPPMLQSSLASAAPAAFHMPSAPRMSGGDMPIPETEEALAAEGLLETLEEEEVGDREEVMRSRVTRRAQNDTLTSAIYSPAMPPSSRG